GQPERGDRGARNARSSGRSAQGRRGELRGRLCCPERLSRTDLHLPVQRILGRKGDGRRRIGAWKPGIRTARDLYNGFRQCFYPLGQGFPLRRNEVLRKTDLKI